MALGVHAGERHIFLKTVLTLALIGLIVQFAGVSLPIEQWCLAVLLTVQIAGQGGNVARRILAHRWIGIGPDEDDSIAAVAHQNHQQACQREFVPSSLHFII